MTKSEILETLINYYSGGNKRKFAALIGVTPQLISNWIKRNTLDYEQVYKGCTNLSGDWLLTGEGSLERNTQNENTNCSAVNVSGTTHGCHNVTACSCETAVLQERVKLLEQLLDEKERLIKILMER